MDKLSGKVAVITGAASGMGLAYADRFAGEGMKIVLADINEANLGKAVDALRDAGHDVTGVVTDVTSSDSVRNLADAAFGQYGAVHLLCNNAGVEGYLDGPVWEATPNDWAWTFGVNFWGVLSGVQAFLPRMLQQREGHIVNTASAAGFTMPSTMYSISKHAVVALSELLYAELAYQGVDVHVTLLCPGEVQTAAAYGVRNRPAGLTDTSEEPRKRRGEQIRAKMAARWQDQGAKSPESVADLVVDAIRRNDFYLFTDHAWDDRMRSRFQHILDRTEPALPQDPVGLALANTIREEARKRYSP